MKKYKSNKMIFLWILLGIILIIGLLSLVHFPVKKISYGITFSPSYATYLGLDWKEAYLKSLDELNIKSIRIPTYWDRVEKNFDTFDYSEVDFMVNEAQKRDIKVLLVVGNKQPRWPECHPPEWAKQITLKERQEKTLRNIERVVIKYKNYSSIWGWQVENEALFTFGDGCDAPDLEFLKSEVSLVKKLDPGRPVVLSDSGEWSNWIESSKLSDILGISIYHFVYNQRLGYIQYPFPSIYYSLKSKIITLLFAPQNQKTIITELQSEPWLKTDLAQVPVDQQANTYTLDHLKTNLILGQNTGFDEIYLWGVEWWYFMSQNGYPQYWEHIKNLPK